MEKFVGRESDLAFLQRIYDREAVKTCMVYGRRRIGKSSLLRRFAADKRSIYIQFVRASLAANTDIVCETVGAEPAESFHRALSLVEKACRESRTLLILDEIPYVMDDKGYVASELQRLVDRLTADTDTMIVICGSSTSFMLEQVMQRKNPLYGRFAFTLNLGPLSIEEAKKFHPSSSDEDVLRTYITLGGVPPYHLMAGDRPYASIIDDYLMSGDGALATDIPYDIAEEMGKLSADSMAVLESVSSGNRTYTDIKNRTGLPDKGLSECLKKLCSVGILSKSESIPGGRRSEGYIIRDALTGFYFGVFQKYQGLIEAEGGVFSRISPMVSTYLGKAFEPYCRDLIRRKYPCIAVGSWWGKVPERDRDGSLSKGADGKKMLADIDIDVTATIRVGQSTVDLFGECKFTSNPMGIGVLMTLIGRVEALNLSSNPRYALFSLSGFEEEVVEYAEMNGVMLFGIDELMGRKDVPELILRGPGQPRIE